MDSLWTEEKAKARAAYRFLLGVGRSGGPTGSAQHRDGHRTAAEAPGKSDAEGVKSPRPQADLGLPPGWPLGSADPEQERGPGQRQVLFQCPLAGGLPKML